MGEVMEYSESRKTIGVLNKILYVGVLCSTLLELLFFPSFENLFGCLMMAVSCWLFTKTVARVNYIVKAPFSFFMLLSMFMFHYLPVPATLISFRPVSFGMKYPIETFVLETIMFSLGCFAFLVTAPKALNIGVLKSLLTYFGFYDSFSDQTVWTMGFIGLIVRVVSLARGNASTGDIIGKMMNVLFYYMYTPVVLFFPGLYSKSYEKPIDFKKKSVWLYLAVATIISLATNSRNKIIAPFCILLLLYFLTIIKCNVSLKGVFTTRKVIKLIVTFILLMGLFNTISQAMLLNRSIRSNLNFTELISVTVDSMFSRDRNQQWVKYATAIGDEAGDYSLQWTEEYVKNTWLNRFCNIRVTDETLYLGKRLTLEGRKKMQEDFLNRIIAVFPQQVLQSFLPTFNKESYYNARGDALYVYSGVGGVFNWGEFRVTSNLGDGLATFDLFYFPLQLLSWIIVMILLNTFSRRKNGDICYSLYGLLAAYTSLMKFVNGNGMLDDILYMIRGYWQEVFLFIVMFSVSRAFAKIRLRRKKV